MLWLISTTLTTKWNRLCSTLLSFITKIVFHCTQYPINVAHHSDAVSRCRDAIFNAMHPFRDFLVDQLVLGSQSYWFRFCKRLKSMTKIIVQPWFTALSKTDLSDKTTCMQVLKEYDRVLVVPVGSTPTQFMSSW